jgi:helix-turn-helix protein
VSVQKLYELREVADITGLTLGSVRQYVSRGVIPALYLGRKRVVREDVLERICQEGLRTNGKGGASHDSESRSVENE